MCALLAAAGLVAVAVVGWRQVVSRAGHAFPALAWGVGGAAVLLAYPVWFGLAGPQAVTGVLFVIAPSGGRALLRRPVARAGRGGRQRLRPHRRVPGPRRPAARLHRRGPGRGRHRLGRAGPAARPHLAARVPGRGDPGAVVRAVPDQRPRVAGARVAALARPGQPAGDQGNPARPAGTVHHPAARLRAGPRARCALHHPPSFELVAGHAPPPGGGRRHRGRGRRGGRPRIGDLRHPADGGPRRDPSLRPPPGAGAGREQRAAHHPLRRLGLGAADAVAGRRRL